MNTSDIRTDYLGLNLNSPVIVGACPMTLKPEKVRQFALAGAGAIVLPTLFEEQVIHEYLERGTRVSPSEDHLESLCFDPQEDTYNGGLQEYLHTLHQLKQVTGVPLIASLNGFTPGVWLRVVSELESGGADAIEIMLEDPCLTVSKSADQLEQELVRNLEAICDLVAIPVSVKLSMFHTNLANLVWRLVEAGASGIVCFNHEPIWEVRIDRISTSLQWDLTPAGNINPTLAGLVRVRSSGANLSIAASGGISSTEDTIRALLAGADVVMLASELYRSGPDAIAHIVEGLNSYLNRNRFNSIAELLQARPAPKLHRSTYLKCVTATDH